MDLRFLTKNDYKFAEFRKLFEATKYNLVKAPISIDEIQTDDMEALVRDKAVKAFAKVSLSDINVRYLLHKLSKIWRAAGDNVNRPPSHIFMANPNPVEEAIFRRWGINPIVELTGSPMEGLRDFLKSNTPKK